MNADESVTSESPGRYWWVPLALLVALIPAIGIPFTILPPDASTTLIVGPLVLLGMVLALGSPLFVHFDRQYCHEETGWKPSEWFYWMVLPPLTLFLPAIYLYRRHVHVGVP